MSFVLDQIFDWFARQLIGALTGLINGVTHLLLLTPDVTALPQVQALTGRSVGIVDTAFVLVFVIAGVLTMVAGGNEKSRYTVKDLLPRCIVGFVAAHFSQLIAGHMIELANAVTTALTAKDFDNDGALQAMKNDVIAAHDADGGLLVLVCLAIIVFLIAAAMFSLIVRFGVVIVLTAAAPLALACHALPQTDPVARLWWRSYAGVLAVPLVQAFVLFAGQWMLLDPDTAGHGTPSLMQTLLGIPVHQGGVVNLFVVMVLLWTTVKVPGLMRRYVTTGGSQGGSIIGTVVRVVVVQQLTRRLKLAGAKAATR